MSFENYFSAKVKFDGGSAKPAEVSERPVAEPAEQAPVESTPAVPVETKPVESAPEVSVNSDPGFGEELVLPSLIEDGGSAGSMPAESDIMPELEPEPMPESGPDDMPEDIDEDVPASGIVSNSDAAAVKGLAAGVRSKDADKTSHCWVPRNIMNMIRQQIPGATNRNDALAAYLYVTLNREPVVSEDIKVLADTYNGDSEVAALKAQIDALSKSQELMLRTFRSMETTMSQMMTMLVWLVGERMDASIDLAQPVASMDFLFQEHEFIRRQAANQTAEYATYVADMKARARYKVSAAARDVRRG